jgi:hypothetical protein
MMKKADGIIDTPLLHKTITPSPILIKSGLVSKLYDPAEVKPDPNTTYLTDKDKLSYINTLYK